MKKKIMAVLVAAGMVISLAACGGSSAQSQTA
ncbi:MAG TPA: amino acid ABC transporter substrate-binding protein, partial [Lachnospiraceae bacterium]|nr:amino acid ABC transporter substrate-binding protein [Lachnospiraceae bacterium]